MTSSWANFDLVMPINPKWSSELEAISKVIAAAMQVFKDNHPDEVKVLIQSVHGMRELKEALDGLDQARSR